MTLQEQEQNDIELADWVINRVLGQQDPFGQNVMILWTESGRERARQLILGAFKSARKNTGHPMTLEPQSNDAPVSGVPLSVIIDTLRERLKQSRANLEQANRALDERIAERDEARAQLAAVPIFSFATDQIRDLEAQLTAALAQADALRAQLVEANELLGAVNHDSHVLQDQRDALRQRIAELEVALRLIFTTDDVADYADNIAPDGLVEHVLTGYSFHAESSIAYALRAALRDTAAPQQHAPDAPTP